MATSVNILGQTTNLGSQVITIPSVAAGGAVTYTLSSAQSGSIISLTGGYLGVLTINLPAPTTGATFKFVVNTTLANFAVVITSPTALTMCLSSVNNATPAVGAIGVSTGFAALTAKGASIDISCDGTNYYAVGRTLSAAGSITSA